MSCISRSGARGTASIREWYTDVMPLATLSGRRATWVIVIAAVVSLGAMATLGMKQMLWPPQPSSPIQRLRATAIPPALTSGETLFNTHCSRCHGELALGTDYGPPLLSRVYAPGNHDDAHFYRAAEQGVQAHHWTFGNMPPLPGVTRGDVTQIIAYVRWLQQQVGIQ